jgi:hypothetical protein
MKKLFIHQPFFRLLSPIFTGVIVYMLVLLINNNVEQLQEQFLGEELYVFIGLSVLILETLRLILILLNRKQSKTFTGFQIFIQLLVSLATSILIVSLAMSLFYEIVEGYSINFEELLVFNSIFVVMSLIYVSLFISNQYLYKVNSEKLDHEKLIKKNIEDEFLKFKREINPNLFFDCLERILILIEKDKEKIEELVDHLSILYRYILNKKEKQLVQIQEELILSKELVTLLSKLPLRPITINLKIMSDFLMVPGTVLNVIELISRTSIPLDTHLEITIDEANGDFRVHYIPNDKINTQLALNDLNNLNQVYKIYTDRKIEIVEDKTKRIITIPKLILQ